MREDDRMSFWEYALGACAALSPLLGILLVGLSLTASGCAYKGGKVVDGTNLEIGITVPGTEWSINALAYTGGMRVCGNDATMIVVTNEVQETNSYFGCVTTRRNSKMSAVIMPVESNGCARAASGITGEVGR